jgi:hypothetical protein
LIGTGLGQTTSAGEATLIAPTVEITATGLQLTIDGVRMVFQLTPDTEPPAPMHIWFPDPARCAPRRTPPTSSTTSSRSAAPLSAMRAGGRRI